MLKRSFTYENFNGVEVKRDFYFNLSKAELTELELGDTGGSFAERMQRIVDAKDYKVLIAEYRELILLAYGQKSEDGESFEKSDAIRQWFRGTPVYDKLYMELATDANKAYEFISSVVPADMVTEMDKDELKRRFVERTTATPTSEEMVRAPEGALREQGVLPPKGV